MRSWNVLVVGFCFALILVVLGVHTATRHRLQQQVGQAAPAATALPRQVLWVWERPEDLRALDPRTTGVAVLEETLHLGASVVPVERHQPLILPEHTARIAVVRIETGGSRLSLAERASAVRELVHVAQRPGIRALQIDFDAHKSERGWYRQLLIALRERIPPTLPLEITALASWCAADDWIDDLPVNAAVPMYFRMEPDRRRLLAGARPVLTVQDPLCAGNVGVSTAEPWPANTAGKRIFVFADHGWAKDGLLLHTALAMSAQRP